MNWFQNVYYFLYNVFERMTFRTKPNLEDIENNLEECEFIILPEQKMQR